MKPLNFTIDLRHADPESWINATWDLSKFRRHSAAKAKTARCPACMGADGYLVWDSHDDDFRGWSCVIPKCNQSIASSNSSVPRLPLWSCENSNVPIDLVDVRRADWHLPPDAQKQLFDWVDSKQHTALFTGSNGSGKTYSAVMMQKYAWLKRKQGSRFFSIPRLGRLYLAEIKSTGPGGLDQQLLAPDLIVLDDIGQRSPPDGFHDLLLSVVDERQASGKKTIITSNLKGEALMKSVGNALFSRISSKLVMSFTGDDKRLMDS